MYFPEEITSLFTNINRLLVMAFWISVIIAGYKFLNKSK